jgi:hypothetical protein
MSAHRVILLHADAPAQPPLGQACNGCGVCCAAEPCPIGMLMSLKTRGRCRLLQWHGKERRYRCGAMSQTWLRPLVSRWIAAGIGCDSELRRAPVTVSAASPD